MEPIKGIKKASDALTDRQKQVLETIQDLTEELQASPVLQELADHLGCTIPSVHEIVQRLIKKGYLRQSDGKARNLIVLKSPRVESSTSVEIPILGTVAAGCPILAEENIVGMVSVNAGLVGKGRCFALRVIGDSMINANIKPGNLLIVRQQPIAEHRDIIVAILAGGMTVKRLSIRDAVIRLLPENPAYRPIPITADSDFRVIGKVISVIPAE